MLTSSTLALAQTISVLDITLTVVYLGIVGYLGWLGYRRTQTTADYLLAGRKVHPFIMAMSYGATFISTSAIVGFGGAAAMFGMGMLWLTFANIFVGIFIAFALLAGPTRRMGHRLDAHTFPEFLGLRFQSKFVQVFAGLVIFAFMPLYAAAVLIGGTEFITTAFTIDYQVALFIFAAITAMYVFYGGLKGVLYTDAFQGSIMTVGMLLLLVWAYVSVGGVVQGHKDLATMAPLSPFAAAGHQGWTAMPKIGFGGGAAARQYELWWLLCSLIIGVGIGVLAQPQLVVRFLTVKSKRELNRALAFGGAFILLMTGVAFTVGAVSNAYFRYHEKIVGRILKTEQDAKVSVRAPGMNAVHTCTLIHMDTTGNGMVDTVLVKEGMKTRAEIRDLGDGRVEVRPQAMAATRSLIRGPGGGWMFNSDDVIPKFVTSAMPWFKTLFLLTLLSAAMSTMSSQYHAMGTAVGRDVCQQLFPGLKANGSDGKGDRTILIVRGGILVGLVLAIVIGQYTRGGVFIARATTIFFGLCAATFLPAFIGGLYFRGLTRAGAIASMIVGFTVTGFWLLLVKASEAGAIGLVLKLTDKKPSILWKHPNWPSVDPLLVALPLSILTAIVVSLLTRRPSDEHLERCFGAGHEQPAAANA